MVVTDCDNFTIPFVKNHSFIEDKQKYYHTIDLIHSSNQICNFNGIDFATYSFVADIDVVINTIDFLNQYHKINNADPYCTYTNCINPANFYNMQSQIIQLNAKKDDSIAKHADTDIELLILLILSIKNNSIKLTYTDILEIKKNVFESTAYKKAYDDIKHIIINIMEKMPFEQIIHSIKNFKCQEEYQHKSILENKYIHDFFALDREFFETHIDGGNVIKYEKTGDTIYCRKYNVTNRENRPSIREYIECIIVRNKSKIYDNIVDGWMTEFLLSLHYTYSYDLSNNLVFSIHRQQVNNYEYPINLKVYFIKKFIEYCHSFGILFNIRNLDEIKIAKDIEYPHSFTIPKISSYMICDITKFGFAKNKTELLHESEQINSLWKKTDKIAISKGFSTKIYFNDNPLHVATDIRNPDNIENGQSIICQYNDRVIKIHLDLCSHNFITEYMTLKKLHSIDPIHFPKVYDIYICENIKALYPASSMFNNCEYTFAYSLELMTPCHHFEQNIAEDPNELKKLARDMLEALKVVHSQGIVHFDIKPYNICKRNDDYVLIDFGVCKQINCGWDGYFYGTFKPLLTLDDDNIVHCDYEILGYTLGMFTEGYEFLKGKTVVHNWIPKDPYVKQYMDEIKKGNFDPDELTKIFL